MRDVIIGGRCTVSGGFRLRIVFDLSYVLADLLFGGVFGTAGVFVVVDGGFWSGSLGCFRMLVSVWVSAQHWGWARVD
jgi:hypothetical protein